MKQEEKIQKAYQDGLARGMEITLRQNDIEISIGRAILEALDKRYEFQKEDY